MKAGKHKVWEAACLVCEDAISNPICPACLAEEVGESLSENHPELARLVRDAAWIGEPTGIEMTECLVCKRKFSVCPHCFTEELVDLLKDQLPEVREVITTNFSLNTSH